MAENLDDFKKEAESWIAKAKAAGKSNIAISNRINMEYMRFIKEQDDKRTQAEKDRDYSLDDRRMKLAEEQAKATTAPKVESFTDRNGNTYSMQWNANTGEWEEISPVDPNRKLRDEYSDMEGQESDEPIDKIDSPYGMSTPSGEVEFNMSQVSSDAQPSAPINVAERQQQLEKGGLKQFLPQWMHESPYQHLEKIPQIVGAIGKGIYDISPLSLPQKIFEGFYGK